MNSVTIPAPTASGQTPYEGVTATVPTPGRADAASVQTSCTAVISGSSQTGTDSPVGVNVPDFVGQLYHQTSPDSYWRSTALTVADWAAISGPAGTISIAATALTQFRLTFDTVDTVLSMPNLTTFGSVLIDSNSVLATIDLSAFVSCAGLSITNCPALTTVLLPAFLPKDGNVVTLTGNAFSITTMQNILRQAVLSGAFTSGQIRLAGGTSAGLTSLSAQGQADAATMTTRLGAGFTINA